MMATEKYHEQISSNHLPRQYIQKIGMSSLVSLHKNCKTFHSFLSIFFVSVCSSCSSEMLQLNVKSHSWHSELMYDLLVIVEKQIKMMEDLTYVRKVNVQRCDTL